MRKARDLLPLLFTYFTDTFGLAIVYPLLTPLFLDSSYEILSVQFSQAHRVLLLSILIATFPFAQFFGAPFLGALSDRIGRRKVFLLTIAGGIFGYLVTALGVEIKSLTILWLGRLVTGLFAGNLALCLAAIADISQAPAARARNFGWFGAVGGPGFIGAIFVGSAMVGHPSLAFLIAAGITIVNWGLMYRFFRETHASRGTYPFKLTYGIDNIKTALRFKSVRPIYLSYFFYTMCWITSMQLLPSYITLRLSAGTLQVSIMLLTIAVLWLIANSFANSWLIKRLIPASIFAGSLALLTLMLFSSLLAKSFGFFLPFLGIAAFFSALSWTNGLATISLTAPPSIQGSILGINQSISALASIVGPILGGLLVSGHISMLFLFTGACSLAAFFLLRRAILKGPVKR